VVTDILYLCLSECLSVCSQNYWENYKHLLEEVFLKGWDVVDGHQLLIVIQIRD